MTTTNCAVSDHCAPSPPSPPSAPSLRSGWIQGSFYFGYMAIISYAFMIMLGSIGFFSSLVFVRHIYGVVKCD